MLSESKTEASIASSHQDCLLLELQLDNMKPFLTSTRPPHPAAGRTWELPRLWLRVERGRPRREGCTGWSWRGRRRGGMTQLGTGAAVYTNFTENSQWLCNSGGPILYRYFPDSSQDPALDWNSCWWGIRTVNKSPQLQQLLGVAPVVTRPEEFTDKSPRSHKIYTVSIDSTFHSTTHCKKSFGEYLRGVSENYLQWLSTDGFTVTWRAPVCQTPAYSQPSPGRHNRPWPGLCGCRCRI